MAEDVPGAYQFDQGPKRREAIVAKVREARPDPRVKPEPEHPDCCYCKEPFSAALMAMLPLDDPEKHDPTKTARLFCTSCGQLLFTAGPEGAEEL